LAKVPAATLEHYKKANDNNFFARSADFSVNFNFGSLAGLFAIVVCEINRVKKYLQLIKIVKYAR
jgi:hypothetical protein